MSATPSGRTSESEVPVPRADSGLPRGVGLALAAMLAGALVLLVFHLRETPPVEHREIRIFEVVSSMLQSGDYLVPRINGNLHVNKPPLYYWLACGAQALLPLSDRVTVRLPSALAALGLIAFVFWFVRRSGYGAAALPTALMLAAFSALYENGRIADFDTLLTLFSFAAVAAFRIHVREGRIGWLLTAGALFALALMTKATPALPLVLLPAVLMLAFEGKGRYLLRPSVLLLFILIPVCVGSAWFVWLAVHSAEARQVFINEGLLPFGVKSEHVTALHYKPFYYYTFNLFKVTSPAVVLLPIVIWRLCTTRAYRRERSDLRWVFYSILGILVIFSAIPQKQTEYMVPMLPYLAILFGDAVASAIETMRWQRWIKGVCALGSAVLLLGVPLTYVYFARIIGNRGVAIPAALGILAFAVLLAALTFRAAPYTILGGAWVAWLFVALIYYGSFNVWDMQFKTGEVYQNPHYSESHWKTVLRKYPVLRRVFQTSERFKKDDSGSAN